MDIFWIQDGTRQGPLPDVEIISKLQRGEISETTKGWHSGCDSWLAMSKLPALESYFKDNEESDPLVSDSSADSAIPYMEDEEMPFKPQVIVIPTPVMRFIAKLVDILSVFLLAVVPISIFKIHFIDWYLGVMPALLIPYETLLLHFFGTTPGKKLMNIHVSSLSGGNMSTGKSLIRSLDCYVMGLGLFIFPFIFIFPVIAWWLVRIRGVTPWDARHGSVSQITGKVTASRIFICIAVIFFLLQMVSVFIHPWMNDIVDRLPSETRDFFLPYTQK